RYGFKRDFKLYECDDCSACSLRQQCMKPNSKSNKKIMKNYNWEYFKAQINQKLSEPETKKIYSQRKIDVEPVFGFMKAILGFDEGTMAVVLPHGVLFRGAAEGIIRRYLIEEKNYLEAVIGLPANIFYGTSIPTCILVFKKCRQQDDNVLFIDASNDFEKGK
ncbi:N-6 DNA methylase, partial [Staphylococcus aureus]